MNLQQQLSSFGFAKLPDFDPKYFKLRIRTGLLLFVNETSKLTYHVFTINAHTCLTSAKKLVLGNDRDRALDFKEALQKSELSDWDIYFRPREMAPELKREILVLLEGYQTLNTKKSRIDQNEKTWAYKVHHPEFDRTFTVSSNRQLNQEEVVAAFLRQWRSSLEQSLNRKGMLLPAYYLGCEQVAVATQQWVRGEFTHFKIEEIKKLAGKPRRSVIEVSLPENHRHTASYHQTLTT